MWPTVIWVVTPGWYTSYTHTISSSRVFCQGQVLHCKRRNQGCSSVEGRSSIANSGIKVANLSKAGLPQLTQESRLQTFRRKVFYRKLRNESYSSSEGRSLSANSGTKFAVLANADIPPQTQEPRLQFFRRQIFHRKLRTQGSSSSRTSTANSGTKFTVLKGRYSTANSETQVPFLPKADLPPQAQESRLQFSQRQVFHRKIRNQGWKPSEARYSTANSGKKIENFSEGRSSTANSVTKVANLPKTDIPPQTQEPKLQVFRRQVLHHKFRNQGCKQSEIRYSTANSGTKVANLMKSDIPPQT